MPPSDAHPTTKPPILTRRDIFASFLRWLLFSHANYNWEVYQGTGFAHAMTPIIRRLYKDPEEIKAALKRHLVFFNTEPDTGGIIHGMTIALEEQRALGNAEIDDEAITNVKSGLMGPLSGLGDTLKQGAWTPVWQSMGIGVALAAQGSASGIVGPAIFFIAIATYTFGFGWWLYWQGYKQGQALVTRLLETGLLDDVRVGASVLGAAVLGALGAQFITVSTGIQWSAVAGTGANAVAQTFSLQKDVLDKLFPGLLPLAFLLLIIWLLRRGMAAVDVIVYMFDLALASALIESVSGYAVQTGLALSVLSPEGMPTLIGIAVLVAGTLGFTAYRRKLGLGVGLVAGFLVVAAIFALLSVGASAPIQILAHF